jgi:uncharacterized protein
MKRSAGAGLLRAAPYLMRGLTIAGTVAMFLVGGSILAHGWPWLHHALENLALQAAQLPQFGAALGWLTPHLGDAFSGLLAGALAWLLMRAVTKIRGASRQRE